MLAIYLTPVYLAVNGYLLYRILQWLKACHRIFEKSWMRFSMALLYMFPTAAMLTAFFLPMGQLRRSLKIIGNDWMGVLLYLFLAILIMDGFRVLAFAYQRIRNKEDVIQVHRSIWGQAEGHKKMQGVGRAAGTAAAAAVLGISVWGMYNAHRIQVTPYEFTVEKSGGGLDGLQVVLISDLHLGYNIGVKHMKHMVEKINEQHADVVVIAGDIFDNEYGALEDPEELAAALRSIKSRYGVYACYGNHDVEEKILAGFTFGKDGISESSREMDTFLEKSGICLLKDEAVLIADCVYLYGRPDAQKAGRGHSKRKQADEFVKTLDRKKPIFVLDHQPRELEELADAGVDVAFCGHTHDGQLFPGNLLTALLWENSYGYKKKKGMHTLVTSGVGLFGPNMRVGTRAEICSVWIHFTDARQ